jgi:hypothetical protein
MNSQDNNINHDFKVGDLVTYKDSYKVFIKNIRSIFGNDSTDIREIGIIIQDDKKDNVLTIEWVKTGCEGLSTITRIDYYDVKTVIRLIS